MGLLQNPDQLAGLADVARGEEGVGGAFVGAAGRAADAVDVVLGGVGVVVIDDELHILHVLKDATRVEGRGVGLRSGKDKHTSGGRKKRVNTGRGISRSLILGVVISDLRRRLSCGSVTYRFKDRLFGLFFFFF